MLILYGSESGTSIATLFTASIIPGLLLGTCYALYITVRCYFKPSLGPSIPVEELRGQSGKKMFKMLCTSVFPILILISLVLGSIMMGIAAPSEAASLGAVGAILICAGYRKLNYEVLKSSALVTMKITSMVVFIALGAKFFTTVFFRLGGHLFIEEIVMGINLPPSGLFLLLMGVLFLLGMFMDWIGLMMVFIPIFNPIIKGFGYNEVWYGIIFCLVMCISLLTPPFAYSIFYLKGVAPPEVKLGEMYSGVMPFLFIHIGLVILIYFVPQIVLWLPNITGLKF
jgi:tripartite ATP-independent transporter DctM subunit